MVNTDQLIVTFCDDDPVELEHVSRSGESTRIARRKLLTRRRLTAAASRLIAEKGVAALRLREIAAVADIGFGSFYNYFDSKEDLVEAVATELTSEIASQLAMQASRFNDPAESASAAHRWFVRNAATEPQTAWLIVNLDRADVVFQDALAGYGKRLLEHGVACGRFRPMDVDTALTSFIGATIAVTRAVLEQRLGADAETSSAEVLLGALGLTAQDAHNIARRKLPDIQLRAGTADTPP